MEKVQIDKNKLDLLYRKSLQEHNAVLILATTGVLSFIGTFIWNPESLWSGIGLMVTIWSASLLWYNKINRELRCILSDLDKLKK